jgi:hypothetical protein
MKTAKYIFLIAGIYGLIVITPQYFLEARIGREAPPAITHPEYFYGFVGVALAFQVLFLIIARDVVRFRLAMIPAILEKLSFGFAVYVLYMQGRVVSMLLIPAGIDLIFAGLFLYAYLTTPERT